MSSKETILERFSSTRREHFRQAGSVSLALAMQQTKGEPITVGTPEQDPKVLADKLVLSFRGMQNFDQATQLALAKVEPNNWSSCSGLLAIIRKHLEANLDPSQALATLNTTLVQFDKDEKEIIEYETKGYNMSHWSEIIRSYIAKVYKSMGNTKKAQEVLEDFDPEGYLNLRNYSTGASLQLLKKAEKEFEKGRSEKALAIAEEARVAVITPKNRYDDQTNRPQTMAEIHKFITKVLAASGQDYQESLETTFLEISRISDEIEQAYMLSILAKELHEVGINTRWIFGKARERTENIPLVFDGEEDDQFYLFFISELYDFVAQAQTECGYFDDAVETLDRLRLHKKEAVRTDFENSPWYLAFMASIQVRQGLTQNQLKELSQKDIQILLKTQNPEVLEALAYFGLTKPTISHLKKD